MGKLPFTKSVPGAKKVEDHCPNVSLIFSCLYYGGCSANFILNVLKSLIMFRITYFYIQLLLNCVLQVLHECSVLSSSLPSHGQRVQALLSMEFSRQEYWSGLPFCPPGDLLNPGIKPTSPALRADSLPLSHLGSPLSVRYL